MVTLFIFTRDLRLRDNLALNMSSGAVLPIFIFNPKQISESNKYRSDRSVQFMIWALKKLASDIKDKGGKLHFFHGDPATVVSKLLNEVTEITEVIISADYSPFAKKRERDLRDVCGDIFKSVHNHMLVHGILKENGTPYVKFTPYYNVAKKKILKPSGSFRGKFFNKVLSNEISIRTIDSYILEDLVEIKPFRNVKNYKKNRDLLMKGGTNASPYIKFGVLSPRVLWKSNSESLFRRQLIWRDFYMQILDHHPDNLGNDMRKIKGVKWLEGSLAREKFNKWKNGKTGVPLVDAGMNELNKTGYMHNRVRLVVADFLVKHYGVDWKLGERYFARKLIDYDISNNNGNWQWVAGTGVDSQPYYRTFNPERQMKRYDPDGEYVKKWLK